MIKLQNILKGGALIGALLVTSTSVFAYDQNNTHPALTDEIVDFYNLNFPDKKLNNEEKQWLIQGSIDEDSGERSLFHFYDPIYNRGIAGGTSSKKWALASGIQANYYNSQQTGLAAFSGAPSAGDFSYQRALDDYAKGDKKRAFLAFGHVLHLLEDAGVPDHTRNDPHPSFIHGQESPYEKEMAKWNPGNLQIARELFLKREKPVIFYTMESYFDKVANYSNNNFFSKDTIFSKEYHNPIVDGWEEKILNGKKFVLGYKKDSMGKYYLVQKLDKSEIGNLNYEELYVLNNNNILDGYWERLSPEIVKNGAGALRLFLEEAERAKEKYANKPQIKPSLWAQLLVFGVGDKELTTLEGATTSDVRKAAVDKNDNPDSLVTQTKKDNVTRPLPLVSPTLSPSPIVSSKLSPSPTPKVEEEKLSTTEKININTANKELLMTLKGIKDAKSDAIILHRQTNGPFQKIEDIMNVSGIGQVIFEEIKGLITVGDIVPTQSPVFYASGGGGNGSSLSPTPTLTPSLSVTPTPSPTPKTEKININTASKEQLMTLPGIGNVKSQAVIDYRTANGPFVKIEDIQNVSGIGPVTFNNIKDLITVGNVTVSPSAVTNLFATINSPLNITWSAPDPGSFSPASLSYDLRYSLTGFPASISWDLATKVASSSLPSVGEKGASQSASFDIAYSYSQTLYFALKTKVINITTPDVVSPQSNVATVSFPSAIASNSWGMLGKDQYHTSFAANVAGPGPTVTTSWEFSPDPVAASALANVFRSNQISSPCGNGGDNFRLYDYAHNSQGAFPCSGGAGTWGGYFNSSFNNTTFTEFEQIGTLPCGTFEECSNATTTLATREVVLRADGWTLPPTWSVGQSVADADGNIYFGASDGSSHKLIKLDKNGVKQWEYATNVSIGTPAVLSDKTVYFGRVGAGGVLAFTALNPDGSKKWDYDGASTVKAVTVSSKSEPHFTYQSGAQDKLAVLKPDGSVKTLISGTSLSGFSPVVLDNGTIIVASHPSGGNQFFTAYSADGTQLWQVFYTGAAGNAPSDLSHDKTTGKTYSAAGPKLFEIPSGGSVLNAHLVDSWGIAATMVAITPTKLLVGLDYTWSSPASGSKLFSLNKSNFTIDWSFQAEGKINQQIAVDQAGNAYFSTQSGHLYSVAPNGQERWHISVGANSTISPVLAGNGVIWGYGSKIVKVE